MRLNTLFVLAIPIPAYGVVTLYGKELLTSRKEPPTSTPIPRLACIPNPTGPDATISFHLAESAQVQLSLNDSRGRTVAVLIDRRPYPAGRHEIPFSTRRFSPGIYYIRFQAGRAERTEKVSIHP